MLDGGVDPAAEFATIGRPGERPENVGLVGRIGHALRRLLAVHETAEEEVIHPLSRTLPGGNDDMIDERLDEERQAKDTLKTLIAAGVDADGFDEVMLLLRKSVLEHARHEERYEFPRLRQHMPPDRLRLLAGAVRAAEAAAPTRPHPGTESATANAVVGIPLAVIDRIRDAVRGVTGGNNGKES